MSAEGNKLKFAYYALEDVSCLECERYVDMQNAHIEPIDPIEIELSSKGNPEIKYTASFGTDYNCENCGEDFTILFGFNKHAVSIYFCKRENSPEEFRPIKMSTVRTESLRSKNHRGYELLEAVGNLTNAALMMSFNLKQFSDANEEIIEDAGAISDGSLEKLKFHAHNYLSSAYTFHEIFDTVKSDLPTENVEKRKSRYMEQYRLISGLRTYAQHHLILPIKHTTAPGAEPRSFPQITLEDVWYMESEVSEENLDGYDKGADYHYGHIDEKKINLLEKFNSFNESALGLVNGIREAVIEQSSEKIEEYYEITPWIDYSGIEELS
jgi:hypothetical protein